MQDILGNEINEGDIIAIATQSYGKLKIGIVVELINRGSWYDNSDEPNMVRIRTLGSTRDGDTYPSHLLVIDELRNDGSYVHESDADSRFNQLLAYRKFYEARKEYYKIAK